MSHCRRVVAVQSHGGASYGQLDSSVSSQVPVSQIQVRVVQSTFPSQTLLLGRKAGVQGAHLVPSLVSSLHTAQAEWRSTERLH